MIFGIGIVLAVLTVLTASAAADNVLFFVPQNSSGAPGENVTVLLYLNATDHIGGGQVRIDFDPNVANITCREMTETTDWESWDFYPYGYAGHPYAFITFMQWSGYYTGDMIGIANCTLIGNMPGTTMLEMPVASDKTVLTDEDGNEIFPTTISGTFTCQAPQETFSKELVKGWNLISLPLYNATDMTVANIIDKSLSGKYDALYRYDAVNKSWVAMDSSDVMENGVGYFIHMTEDGTWTYTGSAYTDMDISLQPGLNMIGWLNCSKDISDALSSIEGDYWYVARWNAIEQKFEVYNPVAPPVFNDFTTMERGEGYFISMKSDGTLTESC